MRTIMMRRLAVGAWLAAALPVMAQEYAAPDPADWREDEAPPPPAYSANQLIAVEMPPGSVVRMGVDPKTIAINRTTGIVRYVVVAQGPSAVNASYEGIRCATAEYKVYARQTPGNAWTPVSDAAWKPMSMRGQTGVTVPHPYRLARDGMCVGTTVPQTVDNIVRDLRSGNRSSLYN
ncbi:MAG: CNP1-like family protein [Desulfovibrionaceae bacterium]|jgi:hypothetical protein|nr:CNP1-like family protein [Desulfovibrionaceae bacterium]